MTEDVRRLAEQIKARFPDRVNPPITAENEVKLLGLGLDIAPEVLELLRVFDGTTDYLFDSIYFSGSVGPPDVPTIGWHIELFKDRIDEPAFEDEGDDSGWSSSVRQVMFSRGWTPVISTIDGDVWFIDHDPAPDGADGQLFRMDVAQGCSCVEIAAPSLAVFLEKLVGE